LNAEDDIQIDGKASAFLPLITKERLPLSAVRSFFKTLLEFCEVLFRKVR
jgi:hypothetical protein